MTDSCDRCSTAISANRKMGLCTRCYNLAYASDRPEWRRAQSNKWRANHKERANAETRAYLRSPHGRFITSRAAAKRRDTEWTLTKDQYLKITETGRCHYCSEPMNETGSGLDRVDNNLGYTFDNVVACCAHCNRIKCHILTHEEMLAAMSAVREYRKKTRLTIVK